ncbi:amidase family protein [Oceanobacillus manasiensis]|uniref:amidase family protein n=1 Tax=Oceanobacillus manasiensis TaxID=586413 RepID=UPI0005A93882|nr:amidase family protein [Oceanobacillus manasiensis]
MDIQEFIKMDGTEMAEKVHRKEVKPSELLELSFVQLEKVNPDLNAVIYSRKEKALSEADRFFSAAQPFAGVPVLLKETQRLAGEKSTSGSRILQDNVAKEDANFVSEFRNAGFQFIGHTNIPEFALKNITESALHGPARNPWNLQHSPGGSSGGSAAAVAAGIVPIAGASDGGGSIRIPASFTGLFGLKPTRGRTPVGPGVGRQWQGAAIDFVLTRSVRDSAVMLDVLQTVQPEAAFQTPLYPQKYKDALEKPFDKKLRIAFSTASPVGTPVSPEAKQAVLQTVKWLESEGHIVEEQTPDIDGIQLMQNYYVMNAGEMASVMSQLEKTQDRGLTELDMELEAWMLYQAGKHVSAAEYALSLASWDYAAAQAAIFHETFDFYITPATAFSAPMVGELTVAEKEARIMREEMLQAEPTKQQELIYDMFLPSLTYSPYTQLANLTGQPAMSVPVHLTESGLPLGVQVMAGKGEEHRLLQLARFLENSSLWVGVKHNHYYK